jgi:hypothetical protein
MTWCCWKKKGSIYINDSIKKGAAPRRETSDSVGKGAATRRETSDSVKKGGARRRETCDSVGKGVARRRETSDNVKKGVARRREAVEIPGKGAAAAALPVNAHSMVVVGWWYIKKRRGPGPLPAVFRTYFCTLASR